MIGKFIFFVGLPGCGKSTYIKENFEGYKEVTNPTDCIDAWVKSKPIVVSADAIKHSLEGYSDEHPEEVHEESVKRAKTLIELMCDSKDMYECVILDGGGINNHYNTDIINYLRKRNPHNTIKCIVMDTPIEVCLERISKRNRKVPVEDVYNKNMRMVSCIYRYIDMVDEFEKVSYFKNKYILLDMDGTIAGYGKPKLDSEGNSDFVNSELFLHLKPVKSVIDYVRNNFDCKNVYIVTACANSIAWKEKNEWLDKYFPEIPVENRHFVGNKRYKHVFIKHFAIRNKWKLNEITLVDDFHETIEKAKKMGINCVHPSNVESLTYKYSFSA